MALGAKAARLLTGFLDLLFPPRCVGCGREGKWLCQPCQAFLPRLELPYCRICARGAPVDEVCPRCRPRHWALEGIRSPFLMEGVVREAVHRFKYRNLRALAPALGALLAEYLQTHPLPCEVLVPVPLHPRRERQRGYNQAALLAREVGRRLQIPVEAGALVRTRHTEPQAHAPSAQERWRNVQGGFAAQGRRLEGKRVLLVDDVCTTGATLEACATALKAAGVASVWGLTLARET